MSMFARSIILKTEKFPKKLAISFRVDSTLTRCAEEVSK